MDSAAAFSENRKTHALESAMDALQDNSVPLRLLL